MCSEEKNTSEKAVNNNRGRGGLLDVGDVLVKGAGPQLTVN